MRYQIPLWALLAVIPLACSAGGQGKKVTPSGSGATSSGADGPVLLGGTGGSLSLGNGAMAGTASANPDLPAPWQYYAEDNSFGFKDPSLPDDVRTRFPESEVTTGAPSLVYPLSGAMHPMNLGDITFQWRRGREADELFRIDLDSDSQHFRLYVPCGDAGSAAPDACVYRLPESEWLDLGTRFKGATLQAAVTSSAAGATTSAKSASIDVLFSPEPVLGGLYYWSQTQAGIMRASFGSKHAELFIAPNSPTNDYACAGCHSVSRDGKVIAFTAQAHRDFPGMGIQVAP